MVPVAAFPGAGFITMLSAIQRVDCAMGMWEKAARKVSSPRAAVSEMTDGDLDMPGWPAAGLPVVLLLACKAGRQVLQTSS